jgi:hypothetical protein
MFIGPMFYAEMIKFEFGIPMKLVRLIEMCLNEACSKVHIGKDLLDPFTIQNCLKQGDVLTPLLFNIPVEYATWKVQENHEEWELNRTHQLQVCADDVYI